MYCIKHFLITLSPSCFAGGARGRDWGQNRVQQQRGHTPRQGVHPTGRNQPQCVRRGGTVCGRWVMRTSAPTNVFNAADRPPARSPKCHTSISAHETATEVIVRAVSIVAGICKLHHYGRKYSTRLLVCRDQVFLECSMSTWRLGETESCVSVLMSYFQIWY